MVVRRSRERPTVASKARRTLPELELWAGATTGRREGGEDVAVVGVGGGADAAPAVDPGEGRGDGLIGEEPRGLAELADEDEAPGVGEELLRGVDELEHEERGRAHRVGDVAEDEEAGLVAAAAAARRLEGDAPGAEALAEGAVG